MKNQHIGNQRIGTRRTVKTVWLTAHGQDDIHSWSVNPTNQDGEDYIQFPEGQCLAWHKLQGIAYPMAADAAVDDVSSANTIKVSDVLQFTKGDFVELPTAVAADATRFRKILSIDYDASTITLAGAAFSLTAGDLIEVDNTRSFDALTGAMAGVLVIPVSNAADFEVGDIVDVGDQAGRTVTAVDAGANTVTVDGANITLAEGQQVVSGKRPEYAITTETVDVDMYTHRAQNVTAPTAMHGRVKEAAVVGLTSAAKSSLSGLITFDSRA